MITSLALLHTQKRTASKICVIMEAMII